MSEVPEQVSTSEETPEKKEVSTSTSFFKTAKGRFVIVLALVATLVGIGSRQMYQRPVTDPLVRGLSSIFPYTAIKVDGDKVSFKEFLSEFDALVNYFSETDPEGMPPDDVLEVAIADTIVNKLAVAQLATQYGVELNEDRVDAYYNELVATQENEEAFIQTVNESYGWTKEEFRERIIESIVLTLQMTDVVLEHEEVQQQRLTVITEAAERIIGGEAFEIVAADVHSGFGGIEADLGYISTSIIPETWLSDVEALEIGEMTGVLDLPEGYAMFMLVDKTSGEDEQLHLYTITVPKKTLEEVLGEYLETVEVIRHVG